MKPYTLHLLAAHPLAPVAASRCEDHTSPLIGGVACGRCWEEAIRDDERFAVENELSRHLESDHLLVDDVAVNRVLAGRPEHLRPAEWAVAVGLLQAKGVPIVEIARRLNAKPSTVWRELQRQSQADTVEDASGAA